ncbi:MAG: PQQ-dependent sugar dehydrogenase [Rhodothermales bacterium]|nr:PQQ-dependent sugar dehydrogenase [Rhodothermales bacterium]
MASLPRAPRAACVALLLIALAACDDGGEIPVVERPDDVPFTLPEGFTAEVFAENLSLPTSVAFPPDGTERLFVNELQSGRILIVEDGAVQAEPFAQIATNTSGGFPVEGENGLLGLAFDPDYARNGFVYVTYAARTDAGTFGTVARFTDRGGRGEDFTVLLDGIPCAPGHQIESLAFGPDGMLYVSVGDAYEDAAAQDPASPLGKILRMRPDGAVPPDNPVPGSYTYALGFRNAFDLAFRPNGDLLTTDNGPERLDELNVVVPGGNFGWPLHLGEAPDARFADPIHGWDQIVSPAGMAFYDGGQFPEQYRGALFLVLFGRTFSEGPDPRGKRVQVVRLAGEGLQTTPTFEDFLVYDAPGRGNPLDVTAGPDGSLYLTDIFRGRVYRIRYTG